MLLPIHRSPFGNIASILEEGDAHFIFAGKVVHGGDEVEVRDGFDVISSVLLLGRAFGYDYVIEPAIRKCGWKPINSSDLRLAAELKPEFHKISDLEFALLWNPPGVWKPRLVHTTSWDDDRVRKELFLSAEIGLKGVQEMRDVPRITIQQMSAVTKGPLTAYDWDADRVEQP